MKNDGNVYCPITSLSVENYDPTRQTTNYTVTVGNNSYHYTVPSNAFFGEWEKDVWFQRNKHLIAYAMYNGLSLFEPGELVEISLMQQRLSSSIIPNTPKKKLDHLLKYVASQLFSPGKSFSVDFRIVNYPTPDDLKHELFLKETYMLDFDELIFYASTLEEMGLVKLAKSKLSISFELTFKGLAYISKLEDAGAESINCFVAVAFDDSRKDFRKAIIEAIIECGYDPVVVDAKHIDSDKTINDQIIAEIRRCKFCIADFTLQKNGVYFEAGFALGLGRPVIYVCEAEDFFKNSHFDLKPFQHILYKSSDQLYGDLINKIQAWIK